jgi:putative transposase
MNFILQPWQVLFAALSGVVNQRQTEIIEFQNIQITALLKQLGKKRVLLSDDQRRLLAVKGKTLGHKTLRDLTTYCYTGHDPSLASGTRGQKVGP